MDWTEIKIEINSSDIEKASDIANMVVPYGIYVEDYRNLETDAVEIAHINLIDEELLKKDKSIGFIHVYMPLTENPTEAILFLEERYNAEGIRHKIDKSVCKNEDWENNWKEFFKPMKIGEKLLIRPLWIDEYDPEGRAVLNIEPGLAFGTGNHATTRLCLETLERYVKKGSTVLDTGCGSGILSVASLLLGASKAVGVDIDSLAVKTARDNGLVNGFKEPELTYIKGNLADDVTGKFDIVVANIVADIIILFSKDVGKFMKEDAVFITSGIILPREDEVKKAFEENGFEIIERNESDGWLSFVCKLK